MITLDIDPSDAASISMSALFEEEVVYIWLEDEHPEAQVSMVSQVERVEDQILVLDRMREQVLFVFNDRGQFLAKIDNKMEWKAPGFYIQV